MRAGFWVESKTGKCFTRIFFFFIMRTPSAAFKQDQYIPLNILSRQSALISALLR